MILDVAKKSFDHARTTLERLYCYFFILFFYFGFTVRQDYFTVFEPSQSLGGGKSEILEKTTYPPVRPQA